MEQPSHHSNTHQNTTNKESRKESRHSGPIHRLTLVIASGIAALGALEIDQSIRTLPQTGNQVSLEKNLFRQTASHHLTSCAQRWPHVWSAGLEGLYTLKGGSPALRGPQGTLMIDCDNKGRILHLLEERSGASLEYWQDQSDLRLEKREDNGDLHTEWVTANDRLKSYVSRDGSYAMLSIEGYGAVDPNLPAQQLKSILSTPHRMALFQKTYCRFEEPKNAEEFFATFRMSLQQWQS